MKKKNISKLSWLGVLNFILLQWFFIRLAKVLDNGKFIKWKILLWIVPLTGWWSNYKILGVDLIRPKRKPLSKEELENNLMSLNKTKLIKILIGLSEDVNKTRGQGIPRDFKQRLKKYSKRRLVKAILILSVYSKNEDLFKEVKETMRKQYA